MPQGRARGSVAILLLVVTVALTACGSSTNQSATGSGGGGAAGTVAGACGPAPTGLGQTADMGAAIKAAGLPALSAEGNQVHYHSHLDVIVNCQPVTVPAETGIDLVNQGISPLHTHDTTGVIHIEANQSDTFTTGQLFTEWGVPLTATCLGSYCADAGHQLVAYVNGTKVADPSTVAFAPHEEIAIWYGPTGTTPTVPSSYDFPAGL